MLDNLSTSANLSIQDRATRIETYGTTVLVVPWLSGTGIVSPWWSATRDRQLRDFWKRSDHLAGAVYTMTAKMQAVPNKVVPKDTSVKSYNEDAAVMSDVLTGLSEFGGGWVEFYGKFIEDLITQDNGCFAEIIGRGDPAGPIVGRPVSIAHLDSYRCTRTGSAIYPVVYHDTDGNAINFTTLA